MRPAPPRSLQGGLGGCDQARGHVVNLGQLHLAVWTPSVLAPHSPGQARQHGKLQALVTRRPALCRDAAGYGSFPPITWPEALVWVFAMMTVRREAGGRPLAAIRGQHQPPCGQPSGRNESQAGPFMPSRCIDCRCCIGSCTVSHTPCRCVALQVATMFAVFNGLIFAFILQNNSGRQEFKDRMDRLLVRARPARRAACPCEHCGSRASADCGAPAAAAGCSVPNSCSAR